MKNNLSEVGVPLVLVVLVVFLLNPFDFWMPNQFQMMVSLAVAVLFIVFAGLVWHESAADERELTIRNSAGRLAYLGGVGSLTVAIIAQSFHHDCDPYLVISMCIMILIKIVATWYMRRTS